MLVVLRKNGVNSCPSRHSDLTTVAKSIEPTSVSKSTPVIAITSAKAGIVIEPTVVWKSTPSISIIGAGINLP